MGDQQVEPRGRTGGHEARAADELRNRAGGARERLRRPVRACVPADQERTWRPARDPGHRGGRDRERGRVAARRYAGGHKGPATAAVVGPVELAEPGGSSGIRGEQQPPVIRPGEAERRGPAVGGSVQRFGFGPRPAAVGGREHLGQHPG